MSNRVITGRQVAAAVVVVLVTGCASLPKDLGRSDVDALVAERGRPTLEADTSLSELVGTLTAEPLTADSAIHIALVNNPRLSGAYARLGFAAAEVYAAGRIRNPVFLGSFLDSSVSGQRDQVTLGLVVSFTDLLTVPARKRLAAGEFAAMKQSIGAEVLDIAAEAETAYYRSVSAKQVAALRRQIATASDLSAQLAGRFFDAGNLTPRELAMERAAASEQRLRSLDADVDAYAARTGLAEVLGLSTADAWDAPARLGVPLREEDSLESLLVLARQSRLDLAAARTEADVLADRLGVAGWTRWLGELDVGVERERETEGGTLTGPTVGWEIPIFNQHRDQLLRISADLEIAFAEVARLTLDVENSVRLAYAGMENARVQIAEYSDTLIPQRIEAVERAQEEVNFMLIGIFELIAIKQDEYDAYQGYFESVRDYWVSRAGLARAVGSMLPSAAVAGDEYLDVEDFIRPRSSGMNHSGHGSMKGGSRGDSDGEGSDDHPEPMQRHDSHKPDKTRSDPDAKTHGNEHQSQGTQDDPSGGSS